MGVREAIIKKKYLWFVICPKNYLASDSNTKVNEKLPPKTFGQCPKPNITLYALLSLLLQT